MKNKDWTIRESFGPPPPTTCPIDHPYAFPIPQPPGDLQYDLQKCLTPEQIALIQSSGILAFHCIGDSGGTGLAREDNYPTYAVGELIAGQCAGGPTPTTPCFCYHVGDVIYPTADNQQDKLYSAQFYEPFARYPNAILAIPGNHDTYYDSELSGFRHAFMDSPISLPYFYWTLVDNPEKPNVTIIGLAAVRNNIGSEQQAWFNSQVLAAAADTCLIVAVHYPPYTYDKYANIPRNIKCGYQEIVKAINTAFTQPNLQKTAPDLVLSGHSHSYQRLTVRQLVPAVGPSYTSVITGASGHPLTGFSLQPVRGEGGNVATLEAGNASDFGALKITIDFKQKSILGQYYTMLAAENVVDRYVGFGPVDSFTLNY